MPIAGLELPRLSASDPDETAEGSIDPLGLERLADKLADTIAPGIAARMTRIRFLTASAVASTVVAERLIDMPPGDGVSTPQIAFEWLYVEAIVRKKLRGPTMLGIPGRQKGEAALARGERLQASNYLTVPKIYGLHGVFKTLGTALNVFDDSFNLYERGDQLVRDWEADEGMYGFVERIPRSPGNYFASELEKAVRDSYSRGLASPGPGSHIWGHVAERLRPDRVGRRERKRLWSWLVDESEPMRSELCRSLDALGEIDTDEPTVLGRIRSTASPELRARIDAIDAYEQLCKILVYSFELIRWKSSSQGLKPVTSTTARNIVGLEAAALRIRKAYAVAKGRLAELDLAADLDMALGDFATVANSSELFELLVKHHEAVQKGKPPNGKRPWFDNYLGGVVVRHEYRRDDEPDFPSSYVHPFRVRAVRQFVIDLRRSV